MTRTGFRADALLTLLLSLLLTITLGCGEPGMISESTVSDNPGGGNGGGGGGSSPGLDGGTATPPATGCAAGCKSGKFCSKAGKCVPQGSCGHPGDCPAGFTCDPATNKCALKGQCGSRRVAASLVAPNVLVVLDRSCSMVGWIFGSPKWQAAVAAVNKLVGSYKGKMRFGLTLFPDRLGDKCTQGAIPVKVGPGQEAAIQKLLTSALIKGAPYYPNGPCRTNIDTAMQQAALAPALADKSRQSYVLLITDGKQALCKSGGGDSGTTQTITQLQQKGVRTFVVGFGTGVDPYQLNIFAQAGGAPGSGLTKFYKAENQVTLDAALAQIAGKAFGCQLSLKQVPANTERLHVYFDSKPVNQDTAHKTGWDYDVSGNLLTFYGKTCQDLKDNKVKAVDVVFTCKQPGSPKPPDGGPPPPKCPSGVSSCTASSQCAAKMKCISGCCSWIVQ